MQASSLSLISYCINNFLSVLEMFEGNLEMNCRLQNCHSRIAIPRIGKLGVNVIAMIY